jgi:hypothetical protein
MFDQMRQAHEIDQAAAHFDQVMMIHNQSDELNRSASTMVDEEE